MKPNNRKNEHVTLAEKFYLDSKPSDFDAITYIHHSFPEIGVSQVDITTNFSSFHMEQPFFINAITGGSYLTKKINEKLATLAKETGLLMASGSLTAAINDPSTEDSFKIIRDINPHGLIFANIGAEQTVENAKKAIDLLKADALQIHINVAQELIMQNGDRDFTNWLLNIEAIVKKVNVPIIVKEVGFGMSRKTIEQLINIGIKNIDISGRGGTNFAQIENYIRYTNKYDYLENWGQSTVISLLEAQSLMNRADFIASGGIRSPLDVIKSLSLGAKLVGISGHFLHLVLKDGVEKTIDEVNSWKEQLTTIMTLLGKKHIFELTKTDIILTGVVRDWCLSTGISFEYYANRSK